MLTMTTEEIINEHKNKVRLQQGGKRFSYDRGNQVTNETVKETTTVKPTNNSKIKPLTKKELEEKRLLEMKIKQGVFTQNIPQPTSSKVWEAVSNPMTALGYVARNETLPDNFSKGERNPLDMATDVINPAFYANEVKHFSNNVKEGTNNLSQGEFTKAGDSFLGAGMNALSVLPLAAEYKNLNKILSSTKNTLSNASPIIGEITNNPKMFFQESNRLFNEQVLEPIKNVRSNREIKGILKSKIDELNNIESLSRMEAIGVDSGQFIKDLKNTELKFSKSGSSMAPNFVKDKSFLFFDKNQAKMLRDNKYSLSNEAIIDHEIGHLMQNNKGILSPTKLDEASDELIEITSKEGLSPRATDNLEYFTTAKRPNLTKGVKNKVEYYQKIERLPFLRETKRELIEKGLIKSINSTVTPEILTNLLKTETGSRILSFTKEKDFEILSQLLNKTPVVLPIAGASYLATQGGNKQQGGVITDNERKFLEEFAQLKNK